MNENTNVYENDLSYPNLSEDEDALLGYVFHVLGEHFDEVSWDIVRNKKNGKRYFILVHNFDDENGEETGVPLGILEPEWSDYIPENQYINQKSNWSFRKLWSKIKFHLGW
jgi:hypothetical protein